jgi:hypothetical protein
LKTTQKTPNYLPLYQTISNTLFLYPKSEGFNNHIFNNIDNIPYNQHQFNYNIKNFNKFSTKIKDSNKSHINDESLKINDHFNNNKDNEKELNQIINKYNSTNTKNQDS